MGYTTEFDGEFKLNKKLDDNTAKQLEELQDIRHEGPTDVGIGIWCKWAPTQDRLGIQWNGAEKFYDYVEWLKYIVKTFLAPRGYILNGEVEYQGEEMDDRGMLCVKDNVVAEEEYKTFLELKEENKRLRLELDLQESILED